MISKKTSIIGIFSIVIIIGVRLYYRININYKLKKEGVYVIGKLTNSSFEGSEIGWIHDFEYFYQRGKYYTSSSDPLKEHIRSDSLVLLVVLPQKPRKQKLKLL